MNELTEAQQARQGQIFRWLNLAATFFSITVPKLRNVILALLNRNMNQTGSGTS